MPVVKRVVCTFCPDETASDTVRVGRRDQRPEDYVVIDVCHACEGTKKVGDLVTYALTVNEGVVQ